MKRWYVGNGVFTSDYETPDGEWVKYSDVEALEKELAESKSDLNNAERCAKEYDPEFPWAENVTASNMVWALGQAYKGVSGACDDLHKVIEGKDKKLEALEKENKELKEDINGIVFHLKRLFPETFEKVLNDLMKEKK